MKAVLYYPLFSNMYAYDSIEEGFDAVLQYCDALQELQRRDDAADALAARYKNTYSNQNADVSNQNADVLASSAELMHMTYMQMQKHTEKRKNQTLGDHSASMVTLSGYRTCRNYMANMK